jgi:hypothetical protein
VFRRSRFVLLSCVVASCVGYVQPPTEAPPVARLAAAEGIYRDARDLYFQSYVAEANGTGRSARGISLAELQRSAQVLRERAAERLAELDTADFGAVDRRAIATMLATLAESAGEVGPAPSDTTCRYQATGMRRETLTATIYHCYGRAAARIVTAADTIDRLTVLGRLATEPDAGRRRALFTSLKPVWESVNGTNDPGSPWRTLVGLSSRQWRDGGSPVDEAARSLGMEPSRVESILRSLLDAWRAATPDTLVEPWDWYHQNGAARRRLAPRVPRADLERLTKGYFAGLGASPDSLGVQFDLDPRDGKTPVAFSQFGGVPRRGPRGPIGAEPWVFATYREGGLGNLVELLHETGHAIHIAAIDTRPAFADWPDSTPLTEGLADVPALEAYEGRWQVRVIGDSATQRENLREKYGGVMLDVAWALFEVRLHEDPSRDPNAEWTAITSRYLHIAPHPEWSWWAMRGQLIESPGYMMNYALGAMVAADVRERVRQQWGGFTIPDRRLYGRLSQALYRFGRERPARDVLQDFLGRAVGPDAILRDLATMRPGAGGATVPRQ